MIEDEESIGCAGRLQRQEATGADGLAAGRSIVLVGLMGAGKNFVGRRLAARLGRAFVDADAKIEEAANATIAEIFAAHGEPFFREREREVIARLLRGPPVVLASGGGAFMDAETRATIARHGISVWLKADLDVLVRRTAGRSHRPILNAGEPRAVLAGLIAARYPVYAQADITVDANDRPVETTVDAIVAALAERSGVAA